MPIYQYECEKCGHKFDLYRKITENDSELKCPKCGAERAQRDFSGCHTCSPVQEWLPRGGG